jgi:hypothetical protein
MPVRCVYWFRNPNNSSAEHSNQAGMAYGDFGVIGVLLVDIG